MNIVFGKGFVEKNERASHPLTPASWEVTAAPAKRYQPRTFVINSLPSRHKGHAMMNSLKLVLQNVSPAFRSPFKVPLKVL